jgi:hypothetical protein
MCVNDPIRNCVEILSAIIKWNFCRPSLHLTGLHYNISKAYFPAMTQRLFPKSALMEGSRWRICLTVYGKLCGVVSPGTGFEGHVDSSLKALRAACSALPVDYVDVYWRFPATHNGRWHFIVRHQSRHRDIGITSLSYPARHPWCVLASLTSGDVSGSRFW